MPSITYELNGGPPQPVYLNRTDGTAGRLKPGHFSIDTIRRHHLDTHNRLRLRVGDRSTHEIEFPVRDLDEISGVPLSTRLRDRRPPESVVQIVDGRWQVVDTVNGRSLAIRPPDAGYDRIALLDRTPAMGPHRVTTTLTVTDLTFRVHNVGLVFRWQDHDAGTGHHLPTQWSTGLAYFFSRSPGLRLRIGTNVHMRDGVKVGDHVLAERPMSPWRRVTGRAVSRVTPRRHVVSQIPVGRPIRFTLTSADGHLHLQVTDVERDRSRQLSAPDRPELLTAGAVGIIALNCALEVHDFAVSRIDDPRLAYLGAIT